MVLLQNSGGSFTELTLGPDAAGARAAAWADCNGDGRPDLLLATPAGPKLYLNEGDGKFKDASDTLPRLTYYDLTAAAWIDYDGDKRPDILLADGFRGLHLYRNKGGPGIPTSEPKPAPAPAPAAPAPAAPA
ncbi:MAG: VCBS repeat-containing protein, partial [Planctomycetota bacterium]|nr:VCBS repeat-containing protein [Planctomycetota bacterium]